MNHNLLNPPVLSLRSGSGAGGGLFSTLTISSFRHSKSPERGECCWRKGLLIHAATGSRSGRTGRSVTLYLLFLWLLLRIIERQRPRWASGPLIHGSLFTAVLPKFSLQRLKTLGSFMPIDFFRRKGFTGIRGYSGLFHAVFAIYLWMREPYRWDRIISFI